MTCAATDQFAGWISDRRGGLIALLQRLIRARSENPPGSETEVASVIVKVLTHLGADISEFEPASGRPTVVGVFESDQTGPALLCNAHMDTVPAGEGWTLAGPFAGDVKDDHIYGRGAVDHKSPIAALLYAIGCLKAHDRMVGRTVLVFDADEERGGALGMRYLLSHFDPRVEMALYAAPTSYGADGASYFGLGEDNIATGSPGAFELRVRCTTDTRYHVAPIDWFHPAEVAVAVANALSDRVRAPRWFGGHPRARLRSAEAGEQTWEVFILPGEDPAELLRSVRDAVSSVEASLTGASCELVVDTCTPPSQCAPDHPLVVALTAGAQCATGRTPSLASLPTVTGMSIIQEALGVPVAAFGYGRIDLCHTANERISVDALLATALAYAEALSRLRTGLGAG